MRNPPAHVVPLIPRQVAICLIRPNLECRTAWTLKMLKRCKQMWKVLKPRDSSHPAWILSESALDDLRNDGHGVAPDFIYAKGVPNIPSPSPGTDFDKQLSSLILIELGFCADLTCHIKKEEKANKYAPLIAKLKEEWGAVYLVCIPVG